MKYLRTISMLLLLLPLHAMAQFAWYGENGKAKVNTGLGNGTNADGVWFAYTDQNDDGASVINFSYPYSEDKLPDDAHVKRYKGIKGQAVLDVGNARYRTKGYAGFGFPIVGLNTNPNSYEQYEAGDATKWKGLAIGYSSDIALVVQLSLSDQKNHDIGYGYPEYTLPSTNNKESFVRISWDEFLQPEWAANYYDKISGPEAAKELVVVKFYMMDENDTYNFKITKIGSYNMQETPGVSTGIEEGQRDPVKGQKDEWYTIDGRKLSGNPNAKGVYIVNGYKMVVK